PHLAGQSAGAALHARLKKEKDVRALADLLHALAETGWAAAGPDLLPLLRHSDPAVASAAIRAVGPLRVEAALPVLMELVMSPEGDAWGTLESLRALQPKDLLDEVLPFLKKEESEKRRERAITLFYAIEGPEAEPALVKALSDPATAETAYGLV